MLNDLGNLSSSNAISSVPVFSTSNSLSLLLASTSVFSAPLVSTVTPMTESSLVGIPTGSYLGEGLGLLPAMPVPDKLVGKILKL